MAEGMTVDYDELARVARQLRDGGDGLTTPPNILEGAHSWGRPRIARAAAEFAERWNLALPTLGGTLLACGDAIVATRQAYADADAHACVLLPDIDAVR